MSWKGAEDTAYITTYSNQCQKYSLQRIEIIPKSILEFFYKRLEIQWEPIADTKGPKKDAHY